MTGRRYIGSQAVGMGIGNIACFHSSSVWHLNNAHNAQATYLQNRIS
jgi:hypothetical protein